MITDKITPVNILYKSGNNAMSEMPIFANKTKFLRK